MHLHCPFKCVFLCVNESCYSSTFILPQSNHHYILYKFLVLSIDLSSVTEHRCNIHIRSLAHSRKCRGATKNGFTCFCTDDSSGNWQHRTVISLPGHLPQAPQCGNPSEPSLAHSAEETLVLHHQQSLMNQLANTCMEEKESPHVTWCSGLTPFHAYNRSSHLCKYCRCM